MLTELAAVIKDMRTHQQPDVTYLAWMASEPIQEFLEKISNELLCHSLDAERKAAQVKHREGRKVTNLATASLNNRCVRLATER